MSSRSSWSEICSRSQHLGDRQPRPARPASIRMQASVTSRAKRSGRIAASRRPLPRGRPRRRRAPAPARGRRRHAGLAGVALDEQPDALARLLDQLRRPDQARVLAEPEHPRDELARVGVLGPKTSPSPSAGRSRRSGRSGARSARRCGPRSAPRRCRPARRTATGCGSRTRADRSRRGAGSRARPWRRRRPCRGSARAGRRGSPRARARGRRGRTARPGTAAGRGRPCAAPSSSRSIV